MGGLLRCDDCGEVHWNLRFRAHQGVAPTCRVCGSPLKAEPRRFERLASARRDSTRRPGAAGLGSPRAS